MSALNTGYTIVNLQNDALQLADSLKTALTSNDTFETKLAWRDVLANSGKVINGLNDLASNNPTWNKFLGPGSNLLALRNSANAIEEVFKNGGSFSDIKAKDALSYLGGLSDFAGNFLIKPGPTLVAGLALKGLGTGAGLAQNMVGDQSIAQLFGSENKPPVPVVSKAVFPAAPSGVNSLGVQQSSRTGNTQVDSIWIKLDNGGYQKVETATTYDASNRVVISTTAIYQFNSNGKAIQGTTITRDAQGNTTHTGVLRPSADGQSWESVPVSYTAPAGLGTSSRNSAAFISDTGAHTVQFLGGGVDDLWVVQNNQGNNMKRDEFRAAFLACNPSVNPDALTVYQGVTYYVPQKQADGSITYHYANGTSINYRADTGEYHVVVPNRDGSGGQTVYARTQAGYPRVGDSVYSVRQAQTNAIGDVISRFEGIQNGLNGDISFNWNWLGSERADILWNGLGKRAANDQQWRAAA